MRQSGQDPEQILFRNILLRLRNADTTNEDWNHLMKQTPTRAQDQSPFVSALRLFPTVEAVVSVVILLLLSRQYTLEPMRPKFHLMMLVAWNQL